MSDFGTGLILGYFLFSEPSHTTVTTIGENTSYPIQTLIATPAMGSIAAAWIVIGIIFVLWLIFGRKK